MKKYTIGILFGILVTLPMISLISLVHEVIGHIHLPVELLHGSLGPSITNAVLFAEQAFIMIPYFLWGMLVNTLAYIRLDRMESSPSWRRGGLIGLVFAFPLMLISVLLAQTWGQILGSILILLVVFVAWGIACIYLYNYFSAYIKGSDKTKKSLSKYIGRRQVLAASLAVLATAFAFGIGRLMHLNRRNSVAATVKRPDAFPSTLQAELYAAKPETELPERGFARYQSAQHPIGVCFSGGGPRAMSIAMGQMRGLKTLGLLERIGAISAVSGGAWFSTLFTYAPDHWDDETLLGAILEPEEITLDNLATIDPHTIAAPITAMSDQEMLRHSRDVLRSITLSDTGAFNRFLFASLK